MIDYAFHHCECVTRIVRGDASALNDMDLSVDGFWRSFGAIALSIPALFFTWVASARDLAVGGYTGSMPSLLARQAGLDLFLWLMPVLALALLLPALGLGRQFTQLIVARNWLSLIIAYVVAALTLIDMFIPDEGDGLMITLYILVLLASVWVFARVTLVALDGQRAAAFSLVAAEVLIIFLLAGVLSAALGLTLPL
ncbi:MAG: hypothetical protein AAFO77_03965 [Pseudomonadota bacterium]